MYLRKYQMISAHSTNENSTLCKAVHCGLGLKEDKHEWINSGMQMDLESHNILTSPQESAQSFPLAFEAVKT